MNASKAVLLIMLGIASAVLVSRIVPPAQAAAGSGDYAVVANNSGWAVVLNTTTGGVRFCASINASLNQIACSPWSD